MELFEIAKNMELEGKQLYEDQAKNTDDEGLKNILLMLAGQEQEHYKIFDALHKNQPIKIKRESFKGITDFFKEIRHDFPKDQLELYKKILDVEKKSQEFYKELAKNQEAKEIKEILLKIAEEEHKHWIIIKNIIEYIKKPDQWVEDPEFHYLEEY